MSHIAITTLFFVFGIHECFFLEADVLVNESFVSRYVGK